MDINVSPIANNYNLNTTHPLQANANTYIGYPKYVSIHSTDRDVLSYPNSTDFEIELPQALENVASVSLYSWDFPANYEVFTTSKNNRIIKFTITEPFLPSSPTLLQEAIYNCLEINKDNVNTVTISSGFYTQIQIVTELTNKFNKAVSDLLETYINDNLSKYSSLLPINDNTYDRFVIIYNQVQQNIWFGNRADKFVLNNSIIFENSQLYSQRCLLKAYPDFSYWGLPSYLGLRRSDAISESASYVRVYYGDIIPGDDGYWLLPIPSLGNTNVYFFECPFKINLMGDANIYLQIAGLNCIDSTLPFSVDVSQKPSPYSAKREASYVNYALAKVSIPTTPISQWFGNGTSNIPSKTFNPPLSRIKNLKIRIAYHDGSLVNFNNFDYSFLLQFNILEPQILRTGRIAPYNQSLLSIASVQSTSNPTNR
jgi:hypothetical protein